MRFQYSGVMLANSSLPKPLKFGFLSRWLQSDLLQLIEKAKTQRYNVIMTWYKKLVM
ncbi:hypothetical protein BH14830 [Bartonella henselae str. Houston-1]|uniref:Uncharacterized protein n=1 Tax=Bartonella henselae (strain ATCC 49882 / DSM 28221 / CCUG 30454 / Houston 1) TaxID=283166 RepID=A0A0H3LYH4_BARHE|nr:hypothetical protein BH14830 [Bartonella henselae str. Houston-1]